MWRRKCIFSTFWIMLSIFVFLCSALAILEKHVEEKVHFFNFLECLHYTGWKAYQIVFQPIDPFLLAKNANFYKKTPKMLNIIQKVEKMHFLLHIFFQNCCQLVEKLFDMLFTQSRCARNQGLEMFWCFLIEISIFS